MRSALALALATLAACSPDITVGDDAIPTGYAASQGDVWAPALHPPYLLGATISITVSGNSIKPVNMENWTFQSSNPSVFAFTSPGAVPEPGEPLVVTGVANASGMATLSLLDETKSVIYTRAIEVAAPDAVMVEDRNPLALGETDAQAQLTHPQLLADSENIFLVRWLAHGVALGGAGTFSVDSAADSSGIAEVSTDAYNGTWLTLIATLPPSSYSVDLYSGDLLVATLPFDVVDLSAIANLQVVRQDESAAESGQLLNLYPQAVDSAGHPIYGANYTYSFGSGSAQSELYEIFSYRYDPKEAQTLTLLQDLGAQTSIVFHGEPVLPGMGCNSVGGGSGVAELIALLGFALLIAAKTRRPARARGARGERL